MKVEVVSRHIDFISKGKHTDVSSLECYSDNVPDTLCIDYLLSLKWLYQENFRKELCYNKWAILNLRKDYCIMRES